MSKFSANLVLSLGGLVEAEQYQKNIFERSEYTKLTNHRVAIN